MFSVRVEDTRRYVYGQVSRAGATLGRSAPSNRDCPVKSCEYVTPCPAQLPAYAMNPAATAHPNLVSNACIPKCDLDDMRYCDVDDK